MPPLAGEARQFAEFESRHVELPPVAQPPSPPPVVGAGAETDVGLGMAGLVQHDAVPVRARRVRRSDQRAARVDPNVGRLVVYV